MGKRTKPGEPPPEYTAESIQVLSPAEAVRRRPEMYLGPERRRTSLVAQAALASFSATEARCSRVEVSWTSDGVVQLVDDDWSLDTGEHPRGGTNIERLLSTLFAGGSSARGVGLPLANLMSEWFLIEVHQPERLYRQRFDVAEPRPPETGVATPPWRTLVTFKPDERCVDPRTPLTVEALIEDIQFFLEKQWQWHSRSKERLAVSFEPSPGKLVLRREPSVGSPPADKP
jgi:DNA gyrase/topoisomerase IV subunit B